MKQELPIKFAILFGLAIWLIGFKSIQAQSIETGYGRQSRAGFAKSVNGTEALAKLFRKNGSKVRAQGVLSPSIERHSVIVWFPDDFGPPSAKVCERLTEWLNADFSRTLIIVGRDYDAASDYWQEMANLTNGMERESARRQWALNRSQHLARTIGEKPVSTVGPPAPALPPAATASNFGGCPWFNIEFGNEEKITTLTGQWSSELDVDRAKLQFGRVQLIPVENSAGQLDQDNTLLVGNGMPFAFSITEGTSKVIVINNGSAFLNYPLLNSENRILAQELINECSRTESVLFLESDANGIEISSTDVPKSMWSWVTEEPLRYIVPHLLCLGLIACFVFFPILGRPRKGEFVSSSSFGRHIAAIGYLLQSSQDSAHAAQAIEFYRKHIKHDVT